MPCPAPWRVRRAWGRFPSLRRERRLPQTARPQPGLPGGPASMWAAGQSPRVGCALPAAKSGIRKPELCKWPGASQMRHCGATTHHPGSCWSARCLCRRAERTAGHVPAHGAGRAAGRVSAGAGGASSPRGQAPHAAMGRAGDAGRESKFPASCACSCGMHMRRNRPVGAAGQGRSRGLTTGRPCESVQASSHAAADDDGDDADACPPARPSLRSLAPFTWSRWKAPSRQFAPFRFPC